MAESASDGGATLGLSAVERLLMQAAAEGDVATLAQLGGPEALAAEDGLLRRSPLLPELARTLAAQSEVVGQTELDVLAQIVLGGLTESESPLAFGETLDVLLGAGNVLALLADQISAACLTRASQRRENPALAGEALEGALRIALGRWVPEYELLGALVRLRQPESHLFSRPALRCLGVAYEHWRDQRLVQSMTLLAGLDGPVPDGLAEETRIVEFDAAQELGHVALFDALTAPSLAEAMEQLDTAHRRFGVARTDEDRVDARLMATAVEMLVTQLPEGGGTGGQPGEASSAEKLTRLAEELLQTLGERQLGYVGLERWRGARLDAETAWVGLARDVAVTATAITQRSWYDAPRMLTDVLAAYQATRCTEILSNADVAGLRTLLAPRITQGIGRSAALLTHLEDHVKALESAVEHNRGSVSQVEEAAVEAAVARQLLEAARIHYEDSGGGTPKPPSATRIADSERFPFLASVLPAGIADLDQTSPAILAAIEGALAERNAQIATGGDSLVLSEIYSDCQRKLLPCGDYRGDVKAALDQLLVILLRFLRFRAQLSESRPGMEYLFRADALESELAADLERFLASSEIGFQIHTEVRDIGGGRIDIAVFYEGFTLICELKREFSDVSIQGQRRYLLQAATYQSADVQLGFLITLDLRTRSGPPPHLRSNVDVVAVGADALGGARYVVVLVVPGNRVAPSAVR